MITSRNEPLNGASRWSRQKTVFASLTRSVGKGEEGGFREVFQKTIEARTLFIVAEVKRADCWLITGYWQ
ncbi:MAG: hypothetical protein NTW21_36605 [Verrucomicrobia bacterium]|nr:hypothetical protein [Verrucomicrobiota bacterium]